MASVSALKRRSQCFEASEDKPEEASPMLSTATSGMAGEDEVNM